MHCAVGHRALLEYGCAHDAHRAQAIAGNGINKMTDSHFEKQRLALDRAISLVETALNECDEHGFVFAAIDLSSALDKLKQIKPL